MDQREIPVGTKVEITGNKSAVDGKGNNGPYFGFITGIVSDGYLVRPRWKKWAGHWYYFEVKKVTANG